MKIFSQIRSPFRAGTLSLKTVLSIYFIPISILPAIFLSFYSQRLFEESLVETLARRSASERDAIVAEMDSLESELRAQTRSLANQPRLLRAVAARDREEMTRVLATIGNIGLARVYGSDGAFLAGLKTGESPSRVAYLPKEGLRRVRTRGETMERYFVEETPALLTVVRILLKNRDRVHGVLEVERLFGQKELADLKNRRGVDAVFLDREFTSVAATFALSKDVLRKFSAVAYQPAFRGSQDPIVVELGDARYSAFLYDLPASFGRNKRWGYIALFISMTSVDATLGKMKLALVYLTVLLILLAALLIFIFSNRLVKPIATLVVAMKRVKSGRVEAIPSIDSTYEIEYLVRSFNEMARNVTAAKRTLEMKLEELRDANIEIKNTQSTLVQSAKMISLGQIVAGVAHELNNPIAFIYSNMHHLFDYIEKVKELVAAYRAIYPDLKPADRERLETLDKTLEIDYVLKDMEDLTRSCVEGANRTKEIVLGLRTFSRMDESDFKSADLHEGLRSTLKLLASELKGRITVEEDFGPLPLVDCSLSQLNQVFMNLLSNAAHAIEGRGVIRIRTRHLGDEVKVEIEDSGSGMTPETLEKVFDPFFTTKKVGQGTGLGLSIAYGLIQKHHGRISVKSEIGKGTCFSIFLPIHQPTAQSVTAG